MVTKREEAWILLRVPLETHANFFYFMQNDAPFSQFGLHFRDRAFDSIQASAALETPGR